MNELNDINEGLEYAQMLEIPVSTVNVVKKKSWFSRKAKPQEDLKARVVESVNGRTGAFNANSTYTRTYTDNNAYNTNSGYPSGGASGTVADAATGEYTGESYTNNFVRTEDYSAPLKAAGKHDRARTVIICEAVAACLLAAGIFLCNFLLPDTAINTFVGNLTSVRQKEASYTDFTLTSPVSDASDATVSVTAEGVIHFTEKTSVYPLCDGEIASVTESEGTYTVKIEHTSSFCSVVTGLNTVYAEVGESVKGNLPFAYSDGTSEVSISMYDGETLLNCYTLTGAVPVWNS